ncbi:MAG: PCMD domain-containing protein [Prevotella sp.]|nr:PCMD domain-containing protein [Prevotella sp.]
MKKNARWMMVLAMVIGQLSFFNATAQATDYTDKLLVLVNGVGNEQDATISVNEHDGLYDLKLKNFALASEGTHIYVGNVEVTDIKPQTLGNAIILHVARIITISEGDVEGVDFWMGPMLGELPVEITAVIKDGKVRARIGLDLMDTELHQIIDVRFGSELVKGTGYHIPNGDFEEWHKSKDNNDEPNSWHSFGSATGTWASMAGKHIEKSDKGRNESTCARIYATFAFVAIANGTMTTGRLKAESMSASSDKNNAYLDMSETDKDGNGDPFYVSLKSRPDSLVLYMQFKQATTNKDHPYATVSAVITDGTYYQDPEDKTYTNVVAKAKNKKIAVTNGNWERISIPFEYTSNNVDPKAILVTISTNADAGEGSSGDEVLVDDLTLVYNDKLSSLNVEGFDPNKFEYEVKELNADNLNPVANSRDAIILQTTEETDTTKSAVITVLAADMRSSNTYKVTVKNTSGIKQTTATTKSTSVTRYGIDGRRVNQARKGQVIIIKQADGKTVKVIQ